MRVVSSQYSVGRLKKVSIRDILIASVYCLLPTVYSLSCSSQPSDLTPLVGTDSGLVEIVWGEGTESAAPKMLRIPGLVQLTDTVVVLEDEPLFITADSVVPPRVGDLTYQQLRFTGGTFFGYDVDRWLLWFSDDGMLRNLDVVFPSGLPQDEVYADAGDKLLMLYGVPEKGGLVWKKYRSRTLTQLHSEGEDPETGTLLTWGRIPGHVTISFHDLFYADSLEQIEYADPISLEDWRTRTAER